MTKPTYIGRLKSGEAVYVDAEDYILIEKDHERLVEPKPEEWTEANRIWNKSKNAEALLPDGITATPSCGRLDRKAKGKPVTAR